MLLYSTQDSPRLRYVCDFIGETLTGKPLVITTDAGDFARHEGPKINYSTSAVATREYWIYNTQLLFEAGIRPVPVVCFEYSGCIVFFQTPDGDLPFDLLSATFYLLSRYEEYLPLTPDAYNRYAHTESLAYRNNFLHLPIINTWLKDLRLQLANVFDGIVFRPLSFSFLPTYDIDIAYSYRGKGFLRNLGGMLRSACNREWAAVYNRIGVLAGRKHDPFDAFEWMDALHQRYRLAPLYFFLLAAKQVGYDKNIPPSSPSYQLLIKRTAAAYSTGIHPSWQTGDNPTLLAAETNILESITGTRVTASRQHYIRMRLPETYRALLNAGITEDFSMGYGSINGFRASVACPFSWYDLTSEEKTALTIYPFCFMDANAFYEQQLDPAAALEELRHYYQIIKKVGGTMITIWHNHLLGTDELFKGWRELYAMFLAEVSGENL